MSTSSNFYNLKKQNQNMAFRKRKKIAKGLHLNFSGSGVGLGFKVMPGISFSLNSKGVYCNTSIPGTGFYSRNRISGGSSSTASNSQYYSSNEQQSDVAPLSSEIIAKIHADNDGTYTSEIYDENGVLLEDYSWRAMRARENIHFKEAVVRAINDCTSELVDMYKLTASPMSVSDMQKKVDKAKPKRICRKSYSEEEPSFEELKKKLEEEANEKINSILFWTNKRKRAEYVSERIDEQFKSLQDEWFANKAKFDQEQTDYVESEKKRMQEEYENACKAFDGFVNGNDAYINENIDQLLACIKVPFDFSINYEYHAEHNLLRVQLDLPEIEDYPKKKASLLATEEISIKDKGKAECLKDYALSVTGMAFFFAGMLFNVSSKVLNIEISAYTQRINKTDGNEDDCYVYSVLFNRDIFAKIKYESIDPILALQAQPNKSKILKSNELREIKPFTLDEILAKIEQNKKEDE